MIHRQKLPICLLVCALTFSFLLYFKLGKEQVGGHRVRKYFQKKSIDLEDTQAARLQRVKEWCRKNANQTKGPWEGVDSCIVNGDRKVIYCPFEKVASTSWKLAMVLSTDKLKEMNVSYSRVKVGGKNLDADLTVRVHQDGISKFGMKRIKQYPLKDRAELFKNYFKFLFVREPMDRLYSGYRDKIKSDLDEEYEPYKRYYLQNFGSRIIKMFRPDSPQHLLKSGRSVKFDEFLGFINRDLNNGVAVDVHWRPFHKMVNPCAFEFDFIGKHETLENDLQFVLPELFYNENTEGIFPKQNVKMKSKLTSVLDYVQDPSIFEKIVQHYAKDFQIYGYDIEKYL